MFLFIIFLLQSFSFSEDFFYLKDLKEGIVGEVKTCLKGTNLKKYPIEIKGVLKGTTEKDLIILGKILDPEFEKTGIFAGMSGSPVYIEGKLLGAVAYSWPFSKEPICGITYWKNMVEMKEDESSNVYYLKSEELNLPFENISIKLKEKFEKMIKNLKEVSLQSFPFKENSFSIIEGGIVERDENYPIEGGYPVAGMLAWGDFNLFASGTITFRDGDKIFAFGHSFLDLGKIEIPFARAYPEIVVPSLSRSFRVSNSGEILGTIEYDGKDAIIGKVGKVPEGIKVKILFEGKEKAFYVIKHPLLSPLIAGIGTSFLFYDEKKDMGSGTIFFEIKVLGKDEIKNQFFVESDDLISDLYSKISSFLGLLFLNPFEEFSSKLIEINFFEIKERNRFYVKAVKIRKRKILKEREAELFIFLSDYYGKSEKIFEKINLKNLKNLEVLVGGGKEIEKFLRKEQFQIKNFNELKIFLKEKPKEGYLNIYLKIPEKSVLIGPFFYQRFPVSHALKFPQEKIKNFGIYKIKEVKLKHPVEGYFEIKIEE